MMKFRKYKSSKDKGLLNECMSLGRDVAPCKIWSPEGTFYISTCATYEEIAGSLVADGLPEAEYWPLVVAGYASGIRYHNNVARAKMSREYSQEWVSRWILDSIWLSAQTTLVKE